MSRPGSEPTTGFPEIPGYKIEGILGRGSAATVYRANQTAMNRLCALKVLHPEVVEDGKTADRLVREARLGAKIDHPNVVRALDVGV